MNAGLYGGHKEFIVVPILDCLGNICKAFLMFQSFGLEVIGDVLV